MEGLLSKFLETLILIKTVSFHLPNILNMFIKSVLNLDNQVWYFGHPKSWFLRLEHSNFQGTWYEFPSSKFYEDGNLINLLERFSYETKVCDVVLVRI